MTPESGRQLAGRSHAIAIRSRAVRLLLSVSLFVLFLSRIPTVSAHGETATTPLSQLHGIVLVSLGILILGGFWILKRVDRMSPTTALYGIFAGIVLATLGAIIFDGLSPDLTYGARSMPFPRSWYRPLALSSGLLIVIGSFVVGWLRWPTRPRYMFLGMLLGMWVSYPYLVPGTASDTHPLGYAIVLGTPLLVGYIVWKDAGHTLGVVLRDPVARRFGIGVGIVLTLFFLSMSGYLSVFPEEGPAHATTVVVLPVIYQIVTWPTLEILLPHIPFFLALSPGLIVVVGMLGTLIGLNGALIARQWRAAERAGMTQGTVGSTAIVGTCTCGCCGPLVAKLALLAAGPSIAAPLYWVFVDSASPLSVLFIVGSLLLFTWTLLYSIDSADQRSTSSSATPAD
jgi:hypothetical protein